MKLVHKKIPAHFLAAIPEGIKYIKKQNQDFLVVERIFCPKGHSLMADHVRIHDEPSIRLQIKIGASEGLIYVDAFWGGHSKLYSFIPDFSRATHTVEAFCPECQTSLIVKDRCTLDNCECKTAIKLILPGGKNVIYVCALLGCPGHRIEIKDLPHSVSEQISAINFFGAQSDDMLMEI
jgi:hypothetical protein